MHVNLIMLAVTLIAGALLLAAVVAIVRAGDSINTVSTRDADMTGTYFADDNPEGSER